METNRRTFLKTLGMGAGAFALTSGLMPRRVRAATVDRNFVFIYFQGGWDTLLSLDPRDPNVFTADRVGETRIELAWDQLANTYPRTIVQPRGSQIELGPVMTAMSAHYDQMCVVRGMSMDTVTHEVGRRYFITGLPPRGLNAAGSAMGTRIVAQQGDQAPVPHLVSRTETYNEHDPAYASGLSVSSATDLVAALQDGPQAPKGAIRTRLDELRAKGHLCDPSGMNRTGFLGLIAGAQTKARSLVSSGIASKFNFLNANDAEMTAIRTRYAITTLNSPQAQAALAFQALKNQIAQCVSIELGNSLDTHDASWATDQPDNQSEGWNALAQLVTDLKAESHPAGGKLIDHTTMVVFSEFGRTAMLNNRDGRDHSLTNACMLLGAGIPHNKVVGKSSDRGMNPLAVDPRTGLPADAGGVVISPTLVLASVMKSAGFDTDKLRTDGLPALMA